MSALVRDWLAAQPGGADAPTIGREALGLRGPDAIVAHVAEQALRQLPGVTQDAEGRWVLAGAAAEDAGYVVLSGRVTGGDAAADALLEIGAATVDAGEVERPWGTWVRPRRRLPTAAYERLRITPALAATGVTRAAARTRLSAIADGRRLVVLGEAAVGDHVRGLIGAPRPALDLVPILRHAGLCAGRVTLDDAATAVGVTVPLEHDAATRAHTVGHILVALLARDIALAPPPAPPGFDFSGLDFDAAALAELPPRPGVYRFYDGDGALLYVGKARHLRQRVSSYFMHLPERRRQYAELMRRLRRFEVSETGSELAALLLEQQQITALAPALNVQRNVQRRHALKGDQALLLPAPGDDAVEILFVRGGRLIGRAQSDGRARGMRQVRATLRAGWAAEPPAEDDAAAQILASWQARRLPYCAVDLGEVAHRDAAARLIKEYLLDPERFTRRSVRYG